jgi:hypothetical protein
LFMARMGIPIHVPYCNDFAHAQIHRIIEKHLDCHATQ